MSKIKIYDTDYILTEDGTWIDVRGFAVRIEIRDEGLSLTVYKSGEEHIPLEPELFVPISKLKQTKTLPE